MKKILIGVMSLLMVSTVVKANLSSEIQTLSNLFQQGNYESAETVGRGILNDSSLTPEERATVNSIMSQIAIKQAQKQSNKTESTMKKSFTDQKVTETRDTGTMPAPPDEDVSSEAKYNTYGNFENVVNWKNDGYEILNFKDSKGKIRSHNYNLEFIFNEGLTWSALSSSVFSIRKLPKGFLFDNSGSSLFKKNEISLNYLLFLLSNKNINNFLLLLNPTLNYQPGTLNKIPIIYKHFYNDKINVLFNYIGKYQIRRRGYGY